MLASLPANWLDLVTAQQAPDGPWTALSNHGDPTAIFEGPDPRDGTVHLWELWPSGRLQRLPDNVARPTAMPRPALVTHKPQDRAKWDRSDREFMTAQQALPPTERQLHILEPHFVGFWQDLQLDPRVWGIRTPNGQHTISLLDITVRDARLALTHRFLQRQRILGYPEEQAAWPKAWSIAADGGYTAQPETLAGNLQLGQLGILGQEERWRTRATDRAGDVPGGEIDQVDAWFRRDAGLAPAQPRATQNSQRAALPPTAPLRPGYKHTWQRLCDPALHRPFKIT